MSNLYKLFTYSVRRMFKQQFSINMVHLAQILTEIRSFSFYKNLVEKWRVKNPCYSYGKKTFWFLTKLLSLYVFYHILNWFVHIYIIYAIKPFLFHIDTISGSRNLEVVKWGCNWWHKQTNIPSKQLVINI